MGALILNLARLPVPPHPRNRFELYKIEVFKSGSTQIQKTPSGCPENGTLAVSYFGVIPVPAHLKLHCQLLFDLNFPLAGRRVIPALPTLTRLLVAISLCQALANPEHR